MAWKSRGWEAQLTAQVPEPLPPQQLLARYSADFLALEVQLQAFAGAGRSPSCGSGKSTTPSLLGILSPSLFLGSGGRIWAPQRASQDQRFCPETLAAGEREAGWAEKGLQALREEART